MSERVIDVLRELLNEQPCDVYEEYTPRQVAKILSRSIGTVHDWCRMKRIESRKAGRSVLIPHDEVERLRASHCELRPPDPSKVPESLRSKYPSSQSVAV